MAKLEFWFEFASTYAYLSASRIETVAQAAGVELAWRPFLLGPIFAQQGLDDSPFNVFEAKGAYMWRDCKRLADGYGIPFERPSVFPRNGLLAARVAMVGARDGAAWLPTFTRAVYHAEFAEDADIASRDVIEPLLAAQGVDAAAILERAAADDNKRALREQTDRAAELGIFGAPSFTVGRELFWGNDRLGDALGWCVLEGAGG